MHLGIYQLLRRGFFLSASGQGDIGEGRTGTEAQDSRGQGQAPIAAQTVPVPWSDWAVLSDRLEVGYICALYSWPC